MQQEPQWQFNDSQPSKPKRSWMSKKSLAIIVSSLVVLFAGAFVIYKMTDSTTAAVGSGLPWRSGAYGNLNSQAKAWADFRGRPVDAWTIFTTRSAGWGPIENPANIYRQMAGFEGDLVIAQTFWPNGQGNLASCAAGAYDERHRTFGRSIAGSDWPDAVIRLAWEFNGGWFTHAGRNTTQFKECFRRVSKAITSEAPQARIDWTMNGHGTPADVCNGNAWNCYPGNDVVDIIGIDSYDHYPRVLPNDEATWQRHCNASGEGLCNVIDFARKNGKQFSVGEWGVVSCGSSYGGNRSRLNSQGDNPFYIRKMMDTFIANRQIMAYETYFDEPAMGNVCSSLKSGQNPKSAAEYKRLWGPNSPAAQYGPRVSASSNKTSANYDNKILVRPNKAAYYVNDGKATHIGNPAIMFCISVRRGAGKHINVTDATINKYPGGNEGYCNYQQEPGLNFVREDGNPAVWLVRADGTKLHVGVLCVPDAYTTPLKKFRVFVVPPGETAGHRDVGDFFGNPRICGTLPG